MRTLRHLVGSALAVAALVGAAPVAMAQTPYSFQTSGNTYTEDFSTLGTWTGPGTAPGAVTGTGTGAGPASRFGRTVTSGTTNLAAAAVSAVNITSDGLFVTSLSNGVFKGTATLTGVTLPYIAMLATGTSPNGRSAAFDVFFDFANRNAGSLSFNWAQLPNPTGTRKGTLRIYGTTVANPTLASDFSQIGTEHYGAKRGSVER